MPQASTGKLAVKTDILMLVRIPPQAENTTDIGALTIDHRPYLVHQDHYELMGHPSEKRALPPAIFTTEMKAFTSKDPKLPLGLAIAGYNLSFCRYDFCTFFRFVFFSTTGRGNGILFHVVVSR